LFFFDFNQFEQLIKGIFRQLHVLRISTKHDITYLDGNRWEQLILSSMPNLRVLHMNQGRTQGVP